MRARDESEEVPAETRFLTFESKAPAEKSNVDVLDALHRGSLDQALMRILHTRLAEDTYAEILDGMPMADTYKRFFWFIEAHPSSNHQQLCPGVYEKAREFRASFDITTLQFPLFALLAFQEAEPGSKQFHLRLLELLAVSCHQIAVYLYEITGTNHHHAEHKEWRDGPPTGDPYDSYRPIIAFSHGAYTAYDQYPHGLADVAGYWAEARIFGGVIVFDRGETETECRELYMHSCLVESPWTIYALTSEQLGHLIRFLLDDSDRPETAPSCPLPIEASLDNRYRWDPWDAMARFHVFRDRYERKIEEVKPPNRCVERTNDWPELGDQMLIDAWDYERQRGTPVDEEVFDKLRRSMGKVTPSSPLWPGPRPFDPARTDE